MIFAVGMLAVAAGWAEGHATLFAVLSMGLAGVVIGMAAARRVLDRRHRSRRRKDNERSLF